MSGYETRETGLRLPAKTPSKMTPVAQMRFDLNKPRFAAFITGAAITAAVSFSLYVSLFVRVSASPNALAMITIIGAPIAYWLVWFAPSNRGVRIIAPVLYVVAVAPSTLSVVSLYYYPGFVLLLVGTPDRRAKLQVN